MNEVGLRKRNNVKIDDEQGNEAASDVTSHEMMAEKYSKYETYDKLDKPSQNLPQNGFETFFIARKLLIRAMAFIYFIAFLVAYSEEF